MRFSLLVSVVWAGVLLLSGCDVAGQYATSKAASDRLNTCADAAVKDAREHGEDPNQVRTMLMGATAYCMNGDGYRCRERPDRSDYECLDTEDGGVRTVLSVKGALDEAIRRAN